MPSSIDESVIKDAERYRKIKDKRSPFVVMYYGPRILGDDRDRRYVLTPELDAIVDSWPEEYEDARDDYPVIDRSSFSDFIRNATTEEKERVYTEVMKRATDRQNEKMREWYPDCQACGRRPCVCPHPIIDRTHDI